MNASPGAVRTVIGPTPSGPHGPFFQRTPRATVEFVLLEQPADVIELSWHPDKADNRSYGLGETELRTLQIGLQVCLVYPTVRIERWDRTMVSNGLMTTCLSNLLIRPVSPALFSFAMAPVHRRSCTVDRACPGHSLRQQRRPGLSPSNRGLPQVHREVHPQTPA